MQICKKKQNGKHFWIRILAKIIEWHCTSIPFQYYFAVGSHLRSNEGYNRRKIMVF